MFMDDLWSVWGIDGGGIMQQLAEIKIFSNEQCTEGGIVEGVREYLTKQQPLVLCLNG